MLPRFDTLLCSPSLVPPNTMSLCPKTLELSKAANVKDDVVKWFEKAGFRSYTEISLLASTEADVKVDIVAPMKAEEVEAAKSHIGMVNIKKNGRHAADSPSRAKPQKTTYRQTLPFRTRMCYRLTRRGWQSMELSYRIRTS